MSEAFLSVLNQVPPQVWIFLVGFGLGVLGSRHSRLCVWSLVSVNKILADTVAAQAHYLGIRGDADDDAESDDDDESDDDNDV